MTDTTNRTQVKSMNQSSTPSDRQPLVTLTVVTLNATDYLRGTLAAMLAQDYPNLEILVSDNGSTDDTASLVASMTLGDPRVRFRRNETTVPMHEHYGQCLQAARGEFFAMLCDDDVINPSFVSSLVAVAVRQPGINVVVAANATIDEQGNVIQRYPTPDWEYIDGPDFVLHWLQGRTPRYFASVTTFLARTQLIREFGGYRSFAGARNDDNLLFLQCAITGRVGFARNALFSWRMYGTSQGGRSTVKQIVASSRQFLDRLRTDPPTVKALAALTATQRKQIIDGVRFMTALELLYHVRFHENPFRPAAIKSLLHRWDRVFWSTVCRLSIRSVRRSVRWVTVATGANR
jgi:glycosyltransferase involved in cell wall biosynthesis